VSVSTTDAMEHEVVLFGCSDDGKSEGKHTLHSMASVSGLRVRIIKDIARTHSDDIRIAEKGRAIVLKGDGRNDNGEMQ